MTADDVRWRNPASYQHPSQADFFNGIVHYRKLAGQAARQSPGDRPTHRRHDDKGRPDGPLRTRSQHLSRRREGVRRRTQSRRTPPPSIPRRVELHDQAKRTPSGAVIVQQCLSTRHSAPQESHPSSPSPLSCASSSSSPTPSSEKTEPGSKNPLEQNGYSSPDSSRSRPGRGAARGPVRSGRRARAAARGPRPPCRARAGPIAPPAARRGPRRRGRAGP